jgi:hypothetical protein
MQWALACGATNATDSGAYDFILNGSVDPHPDLLDKLKEYQYRPGSGRLAQAMDQLGPNAYL